MATCHEMQVYSHDSVYGKNVGTYGYNRKLKVYYSVPQNGTNKDTGLLLFIAGFGGQANSNVYKQMRDEFADKYNLVSIQCDYFGYEFMQEADKIILPDFNEQLLGKIFSPNEMTKIYNNNQWDFNAFLELGSKYNFEFRVKTDLSDENVNNFNDMGLLQAIDNIVAVLNVMNVLYEQDHAFNSKKIIMYGHSHGAYLSYLCNAFAPKLFSLIVDNSAWLYPVYLWQNRLAGSKYGQMTLRTIFEYLAKQILDDKEFFDLPFLYSQFNNNCRIISYHGATDELVDCKDKADFCNKINNCIYNEISEDKVDNIIFKSTNHGLDADFKKLFDFVMENKQISFEESTCLDLENEVVFNTGKHKYIFNYQNIVPELIVV